MSNQLQVSGEAKIRAIQGPVVANSGVITALDGDASEYVRGDGTLADFPTSTGGGSSVSYYLNTSVSQGTIGGVAYKQLSKTPISGAGTDVSISANGYIASYITDANDPALLEVPAGNFNCEFYFSVNSNAHNPYVYAEVYKYDGTTFTLLGSNVSIPQYLNNGTTLSPYYFAIAVSTAVLTVTDRIAIRIYVNVDGRTVTLHTENNHLCQVVTTFSKGLISLNNLTRQNQFFATGTSGTDFNISSVTATHTFNIPDASASARGLITTGTQTIAGVKTFSNGLILQYNYFPTPSTGDIGLGSNSSGITITTKPSTTVYNNTLQFSNGSNSFLFPAATGTLALTSDLSSYVPYTGATGNVNLGSFDITSRYNNNVGTTIQNNGGLGSTLFIQTGTGYGSSNLNGINFASGSTNNLTLSFVDGSANTKTAILNFGSLTNNTNRTYTLPDASGTLPLLESTQTFTGVNTFNTGINLRAGFYPVPTVGDTGLASSGSGLSILLKSGVTVYTNNLQFSNASNDYTFPNATGTIALTSNLSSYVPYTGATGNVNIGNFSLLSSGFLLNQSGSASLVSGYTTIRPQTGSGIYGFIIDNGNTGINQQLLFNNAASYIYTYPSASGTIALTSSLASYVPYTGATAPVDLGGNSLYFNNGQAVFGRNFTGTTAYALIGVNPSNKVQIDISALGTVFGGTIGNGTYTYTLPSATGTLALTSDLGSYLPLTGGTLTGALSGTSASFSSTATATAFIPSGATVPTNGMYLSAANTLNFATASTNRLAISSSGNLGLGVTPSAWYTTSLNALQIGAAHLFGQPLGTGTVSFGNNVYLNSAAVYTYQYNGKVTRYSQYDGQHEWYNAPSGTAGNAITFTQAMTLFSDGNLLLTNGTVSNAGYKLDVNGTGRFSGALTSGSHITSTNGYIYGAYNSGDVIVWGGTGAYANLYGALSWDVNKALIKGRAGYGLGMYVDDNLSKGITLATTGAATFSNLAGTGSRAVLADANGLLSAPVSDISVKENITSIGYGLSEILKMNPVWFDFIDEYKNYGEGRQNGNIAQEMAEIIPEAVFTTPSTGKMGINYDQLHAVYIKAIQELQEQINELKNK